MVDITMDVRDKKQLDRVITAFRRIPGVRDIERVQQAPRPLLQVPEKKCKKNPKWPPSSRAGTYCDLQIDGHQDRLERRPSQRILARISSGRVPLRHLYRCARDDTAEIELFKPSPFQMYSRS